MLRLRYDTPPEWKRIVLADFDAFLQDHAANERKVSHSALMLAVHHPERRDLVEALVDLAREEFEHFLEVFELLRARGLSLGQDVPDPYMGELMRSLRRNVVEEFLLDRLLAFAVVEARGCERFRMVGEALEDGPLRDFYRRLAACEARHHVTYLDLARSSFGDDAAGRRLDELLDREADILRSLELRPSLH